MTTLMDRAAETTNIKEGILWTRHFSPTEDPYETIEFESGDVVLRNAETGKPFFEQYGILFPKAWSQNARDITAQHYLRGRMIADEREDSIPQMINRVVDTIKEWAQRGRPEIGRLPVKPLFVDEASAAAWACDLKYLIVTQAVNFNSPVWYNIGVLNSVQQPSACFILDVPDHMADILNWYVQEGMIFKGGSGAGTSLSKIRSSYEGLSGGGWASGPVYYMTGADASAGTLKSGGRARRAAKMVVLDVDHPDILQLSNGAPGFVRCKLRSEEVARTLRDAGFDVRVDSGLDSIYLQYQNANNSVRVSNEFMAAVLADDEWQTRARTDLIMEPVPSYKARYVWAEIALASWTCADPGLQFDTTINFWHTTPAAGRINASNPCSEYMHIDNSPCNLAATNLVKFLSPEGMWQTEEYSNAVEVLMLAQTIMAAFGDYPTPRIKEVATGFRQIGQGFTNLGALLMTLGLPYDSAEGRGWAAGISALMEAVLYRSSAKVAAVWGPYMGAEDAPGWDNDENQRAHKGVASLRREYARAIIKKPSEKARKRSITFGDVSHIDIFHGEILGEKSTTSEAIVRAGGTPTNFKLNVAIGMLVQAAIDAWDSAIELGDQFGYANAHMSVLAPMGTNGYMMDNDTTGIEPALALLISKKKVDGSHMSIVNQSVAPALRRLGYSESQIELILAYVQEHNSVVDAPEMRERDYPVFDTSFEGGVGGRYLSALAHLLMMAAVQPFISGAISKTVNLPEEFTVAQIEQLHMDAWRLGTKSVALYRNNSKQTQPMSATGGGVMAGPPPTVRYKLPRQVESRRIKVGVEALELYVNVGLYPNGQPGEIFIVGPTMGSTVNGFLDAMAKIVSLALQHGTPMIDIVRMWRSLSFEPSGFLPVTDSEFPTCSSIIDLVAQELALLYLDNESRVALGIKTRKERAAEISGEPVVVVTETAKTEQAPEAKTARFQQQAPLCTRCGNRMKPGGNCFSCENCGATSGCS